MILIKIAIILILIIVVISILISFASSSAEANSSSGSTTEGYSNFEVAQRFREIHTESRQQPSPFFEGDVVRADRDYIVIFPIAQEKFRLHIGKPKPAAYANNNDPYDKTRKYLSGSLVMNEFAQDGITPFTKAFGETNVTIDTGWKKNFADSAEYQESARFTGMGRKVLVNVFPVCELRELSSFYYPMLYTGDTTKNSKGSVALDVTTTFLKNNMNFVQSALSRKVGDFYLYLASGKISKRIVELKTENTLFGDIYPLSSMDHKESINPYDGNLVQGHKYYTARVRNMVPMEQVVYDKYPDLGPLRVEVNKCIPVTFHCAEKDRKVIDMSTHDSMYRIYSIPKTGTCNIGTADKDLYIPSRYKVDFALIKPKLSRHNFFFLTDKGAVRFDYSGRDWVPKYSNVDGTEGSQYPKADSYYTLDGTFRTTTTVLTSQSFNLPEGTKYISGLAPTVLLNPYIPVKKSGNNNIVVPTWSSTNVADRKWWYEKCVRGRVRCMAQARMASNAGTIAYVFDQNGFILWTEPLRFFNLQRSLGDWYGIFPLEWQYKKSNGSNGNKDRRPPESMGNVREGFLNQSLPILMPNSHCRDYVSIGSDLIKTRSKMVFSRSFLGTEGEMLVAIRSVNNLFFDLDRNRIDKEGSYEFYDAKAMMTSRIGAMKSTSETMANTKVWNAPIGGYEFINLVDTKYDLAEAEFTDFTGRSFSLQNLGIGSHQLITKDVARATKRYQDFILNAYTHNYYFPWVSNHRTKYLVVENCTGNTECMIALNLQVKKYASSSMNPKDIIDVSSNDMFCYYQGNAYDRNYDYTTLEGPGQGMPKAKLLDTSYNYPEHNEFSGDRNNWRTYPLIGTHYADAARGWYRDDGLIPGEMKGIGLEDYMIRSYPGSNEIIHSATTLLGHRNGTSNKTVIVIFNEPVFLHSISWVSRTVPKNTGDTFEKEATSGIKLTDKDVTYRNNSYVTLYNNHTHCISSYIMNDSLPKRNGGGVSSGAGTSVNNIFHTNILNYATFGPTTPLEVGSDYIIYPE